MVLWKLILPSILICSFISQASVSEPIISGSHGRHIDTLMNTYLDEGFSGTVLIAKDGNIVLAKGYGWANREKEIPASIDTVYTIGSITKQFTGAAILTLEMQGKLSVEDKISTYFGKLPRDKRKITIHHLLTHTAGLRSDFGDDFSKVTREEIISRALTNNLKFPVGERHSYSNAGYSLLGAIIEMVSGESYDDYLRDTLFIPSRMNDTGYLWPKWDTDRIAIGYDRKERWGTLLDKYWDEDGPWWNLRANGGIMSTVLDLYQWHQILEGDTILNEDAKEKYTARHVEEEPGSGWYYGYGWVNATTTRNTTLITHNGGNGIFFADFRRYLDEDTVILIITNNVSNLTQKMEQDIRGAALLYDK